MTDQTFSVADNQVTVTADEIAAGEITCSCGVINEATATVCHLCGAEFVTATAN